MLTPRSDDRLQAFVDFAPIGMVFSHLDGRILDANKTFLDMVEYSRSELEAGDIHWDQLTAKEYLHLDYEAIAEAKESGHSRTYEKEYISKTGKRVQILLGFILVGPQRDEAVAFVVDISAQKHAEEEVRRLNAELEERVELRTAEFEAANKELEAFCYSVSHDLRAPLRSIDGFSYAMCWKTTETSLKKTPSTTSRGFAHPPNGWTTSSRPCSLYPGSTRTELELRSRSSFSEIAEASAADLKHANVGRYLEFTIKPGLDVKADRRLMRILVDNLLDNAVKFTNKTAIAHISVGRDESGAFFVEDNGVGFNVEESPKLFQPFERLHSPRDFSGSGIGLATVQRIVRKHGGQIWAEAEEGKGAKFLFTI